jgi:hypothetical protein
MVWRDRERSREGRLVGGGAYGSEDFREEVSAVLFRDVFAPETEGLPWGSRGEEPHGSSNVVPRHVVDVALLHDAAKCWGARGDVVADGSACILVALVQRGGAKSDAFQTYGQAACARKQVDIRQ